MFNMLSDVERKKNKNTNKEKIRKKDLGDWTKKQVVYLKIKKITIEIKNALNAI